MTTSALSLSFTLTGRSDESQILRASYVFRIAFLSVILRCGFSGHGKEDAGCIIRFETGCDVTPCRKSEVRLMPTSVSGSDRPDLMKN